MTFGIYIHIPFCSKRCDYCDFATWTNKENLVDEYFETLHRQFDFQIKHFEIQPGEKVDSIFFGGGTPNLVASSYILDLVEKISRHTKIDELTEITVECNPDHVTRNQMIEYSNGGINRISIGIQSGNPHVLDYLGREHKTEDILNARKHVEDASIGNISADLIYGSPVETLSDWEKSLLFVTDLDLNHVSCYALGIEAPTALGQAVQKGLKEGVSEDDLADKYEFADDYLEDQGFEWYEISNWAKSGYESKHNLGYWRGGNFLALGCSAHGVWNDWRFSSPRSIDKYLEIFSSKRNSDELDSSVFLDQNKVLSIDKTEEKFALAMRTKEGVSWPSCESAKIDEFIKQGFINFDQENRSISLTLQGRLLAHGVTLELYEEYKQLTSL